MSLPTKIANIFEFIKRGKPNGVASLDDNGKIPLEELPAQNLTNYYTKEEIDALLSAKLDKSLIQIKESENTVESEDIDEPMYFYPDP